MQPLVYIIGGYCLVKAVMFEAAVVVDRTERFSKEDRQAILGTTAFLFLAAIEAFNQ